MWGRNLLLLFFSVKNRFLVAKLLGMTELGRSFNHRVGRCSESQSFSKASVFGKGLLEFVNRQRRMLGLLL